MAIRIDAEAKIGTGKGDEEVYLPGARRGDEDEGPYQFVYPRLGRLIRAQRRLKGLSVAEIGIAELDGMLEWLAEGFGAPAWAHIEERLAADGDLLDEEHMGILFQKLNSEDETGRPTTSSSGASRKPWESTRTGAPSTPESVSVT